MSTQTEAARLAELLDLHAEDHFAVAQDQDMNPCDTLNWQHFVSSKEAATELRRLEQEVERLKRDADRALFVQSGQKYTVKMQKATVIFGPNPEPDWRKAWCDAIDAALTSKETQ